MSRFSLKASAGDEKGVIMVVILFMMALLITLGVGVLSMTNVNMKVAGNKRCERAAFHAAESGLEEGIYEVYRVFDNLGVFKDDKLGIVMDADDNGQPDVINGFSITYDITRAKDENGNVLKPFIYQTMLNGAPAYHTAYEYNVQATATAVSALSTSEENICRGGKSEKTIRERFRVVETPLVQYFIFNNVTRQEIAPGDDMLMWGRIHSNFDLCLAPVAGNPANIYFQNYSWNYAAGTPNTEWAPNIMTASGHIWAGCCPDRPEGNTNCSAPGNGTTIIKIIERPSGWPPNPPAQAGTDHDFPCTPPSTLECAGAGSCICLPSGGGTFVPDATINALASNGKVKAGVQRASPPSTQALKRNQPGAEPGDTGYGFYEYVARFPLRDVDGIAIVGTGAIGAAGTRIFASHRDAEDPGRNFDDREVTALFNARADGRPEVATGVVASDVGVAPANHKVAWEPATFFNARSNRNVQVTDVNIGRLQKWWCDYLAYQKYGGSQANCAIIGKRPKIYAPDGMVIFISRSPAPPTAPQTAASAGTLQAIRLNPENGDELWVRATAASDNPMYIIGDSSNSGFNAQAGLWVGFAAVADSVTLLSRTFAGGATPYSSANPAASSFNVAIFSSEFPDNSRNGRTGGVENFARLLENWGNGGGTNLNITGCFIALGRDQQDDAVWNFGSPVYSIPGRNFGWDPRFGNPDNWPPYVPSIFNVERVSWFEG